MNEALQFALFLWALTAFTTMILGEWRYLRNVEYYRSKAKEREEEEIKQKEAQKNHLRFLTDFIEEMKKMNDKS